MAKLVMYLLESSALLAFFYLAYVLVLRRETFFNLNRFFLLGILVFSLLFPLVSVDFSPSGVTAVERPIEEISKIRMSYYEAMAAWELEAYATVASGEGPGAIAPATSGIDWLAMAFKAFLILYGIGVVVCLSRTFWTLRWLRKMIATHPQETVDGIKVVKVSYQAAPFSFLNYVFVHAALAGTPEFGQILAHERTHIQQRHSIDLLFVQLLVAFFWFNPVVWQLIKSLKTTHEYIADKKIISSGYSLVEYQTLLLRQLISNNSFGLVHNFNLSFIKKRITMMKNKQSGWPGKVKVATTILTAVVFSAVVVQCNSKIDEQLPLEPGIETGADNTQGVDLPVLPDKSYVFDGTTADAINLTIQGNKIEIDGEVYEVREIGSVIERLGKPSEEGVVIARIDKDQKMGLVRAVQTELRKANRRKLLYLGRTASGRVVESAILLPPMPGDNRPGVPQQPTIDADFIAKTGIDVLYLRLGNSDGIELQQKVDELLRKHIEMGSSNYVVSAGFENDDTFGKYLTNLAHIQEAFNEIYQERAQAMFGKDFFEIADTNKEQYAEVRKGLPRAISIAEN